MTPGEKQHWCLVYASIRHLHYKCSTYAKSKIFLTSSNSELPLRNMAGKQAGKKNPHGCGLLGKNWLVVPSSLPLLKMQNLPLPILLRMLAGLCVPPSQGRHTHGLNGGHRFQVLSEYLLHPAPSHKHCHC